MSHYLLVIIPSGNRCILSDKTNNKDCRRVIAVCYGFKVLADCRFELQLLELQVCLTANYLRAVSLSFQIYESSHLSHGAPGYFIQLSIFSVYDDVCLKEYEPTVDGMIDSWVERITSLGIFKSAEK